MTQGGNLLILLFHTGNIYRAADDVYRCTLFCRRMFLANHHGHQLVLFALVIVGAQCYINTASTWFIRNNLGVIGTNVTEGTSPTKLFIVNSSYNIGWVSLTSPNSTFGSIISYSSSHVIYGIVIKQDALYYVSTTGHFMVYNYSTSTWSNPFTSSTAFQDCFYKPDTNEIIALYLNSSFTRINMNTFAHPVIYSTPSPYNTLQGTCSDPASNDYFFFFNNSQVFKIYYSNFSIELIAGSTSFGDIDGNGVDARFYQIYFCRVLNGYLYLNDYSNNK
eukprot:TRINITY_DN1487_c0_g1_i5.p1 TRINITY_DN1487_c0_g1~~TRINITY_DN1487_c0_g1_i5.p1  ORF type:complete len:277 (-),score=2.45 TRINITY_DN1487_c0_g1_i5:556-1386(-)